MDENNEHICHNVFLSRGCVNIPKMYDNNKNLYSTGCAKLNSFNWLSNIELPAGQNKFDCVEVRFKNSRKDFFRINTDYEINEGDIVAVESSPGHDIGIVTLTGEAARIQMHKKNADPAVETMKKVYRKARATDIEKWISSVETEDDTMFKTRTAAAELELEMKISDVEYQGDGTKAIFYYTADERVDFRKLIKVLADLFKVRIEMRQIGVRQEASRLGGIGSCGRELCCSTWLTKFRSVTTNAARVQQLALNPQKLAGQCSKLKCCINYEYDIYVEALKDFPDARTILKTKKGLAFCQKPDVFGKTMWYAYEHDENNLMAIPVDVVKQIVQMNEKGEFPEKLEDFARQKERKADFENAVDQYGIERFDSSLEE
jgi:cell fate regulator YaaT (PSP1 superfamily)